MLAKHWGGVWTEKLAKSVTNVLGFYHAKRIKGLYLFCFRRNMLKLKLQWVLICQAERRWFLQIVVSGITTESRGSFYIHGE